MGRFSIALIAGPIAFNEVDAKLLLAGSLPATGFRGNFEWAAFNDCLYIYNFNLVVAHGPVT